MTGRKADSKPKYSDAFEEFLDNVDQLISSFIMLGDFAGSFGEAWEALLKFNDIREALADLKRKATGSPGEEDELVIESEPEDTKRQHCHLNNSQISKRRQQSKGQKPNHRHHLRCNRDHERRSRQATDLPQSQQSRLVHRSRSYHPRTTIPSATGHRHAKVMEAFHRLKKNPLHQAKHKQQRLTESVLYQVRTVDNRTSTFEAPS